MATSIKNPAEVNASVKKVRSHISQNEQLLFEISSPGKIGYQLPELDVPAVDPAAALGARQFEKILVDAPCSNTGVLRRRLDLRWRLHPDELTRLRTTQRELLQLAAAHAHATSPPSWCSTPTGCRISVITSTPMRGIATCTSRALPRISPPMCRRRRRPSSRPKSGR